MTNETQTTLDANTAVLSLSSVNKRFGDVTAVSDVDLDVAAGEMLVFVGPSGCGKTTLLRLIAGVETPDSGRIALRGHSVYGPEGVVPPEKRSVGLVAQDYALFPHMTVTANVGFGLVKWDRQDRTSRIAEILDLVQLADLAERYPHELSGGEQQRVTLARSLAPDPALVLLDEPFSNLDQALRAEVRSQTRRILEESRTTAIFVTHDQEEAFSLASRVAVMLDGELRQIGSPLDVYNRPNSRDVAEFIGDANFLPGRVQNGLVEFELGTLPVLAGFTGPADVMVRAENLQLSEENGVPVEVLSREFYGHDQVVEVRLTTGTVLKVRSLASQEVVPGREVRLAVNGDLVAYPARR
ncbi:MAG: ABC transporter ATP-binding protein [Actinomycetota bacterium]|nr:ABC transporter ATP-binding protein [Actinomycetota bacterium]